MSTQAKRSKKPSKAQPRDGSRSNALLCRIAYHHHGRTDYGNWISRGDVWDMIYHHSVLLDGEWIGIEQRGFAIVIAMRGPWINPDRSTA